ncbi:phosphotransferase [Actinopolymorpha sp. B9G3]|uniref:phosphotransferase enzyme family protein n=1 Tax=Actinopolymorpha sp. B9G3 TaxID=3158970 RepID=UPI0032D95415
MAADQSPWDSMSEGQWRAFLDRRIVGVSEWRAEKLNGVTNDTWKLTPADPGKTNASYVARHYRRTQGADELVFELAAVRYLAEQGFPVADVVEARDGAPFDHIQGRPCALFKYVDGTAGDSPGETGCADLSSGLTAARLLAEMHLVTQRRTFPGSRSEYGDPIARLTQWVNSEGSDPELVDVPGGPAFLHHLTRLLHTLDTELEHRSNVWVGLVHGDVAPNNLVTDAAGEVAALLDFDDCLYSYVVYDLASILWYWGRSASGDLDKTRIRNLVDAYSDVRELTADERHLLAPLFAAYIAGDAIGQITWWWRGAGKPRPVASIESGRAYLDLTTSPTAADLFVDQP